MAVEVGTGKGIEETGIEKERKKMKEVGGAIETTIRKEVMTETRSGSGPRSRGVGARWRRRNTKKTRMTGGTGKTKKMRRRRKSTVGVEAEKGSAGAGAGAEMQGSGAEAAVETKRANTGTKARRSQRKEVAVAVREELTVLKSQENENIVPAKRSLESAAEAKTVPTNEITVIARTSQTKMSLGGAKA